MVWIPGGEFTMGPDAAIGWPDFCPSARHGCTPDTGMSPVGFRCVR
jgi:formylglycine-generating enzyme required for sulfatase activity